MAKAWAQLPLPAGHPGRGGGAQGSTRVRSRPSRMVPSGTPGRRTHAFTLCRVVHQEGDQRGREMDKESGMWTEKEDVGTEMSDGDSRVSE